MEIGKRLKLRRLEVNLTQDQVAEHIGVSRQTISNWENTRSYPDIERIIKLSDLYELSLDELLRNDPKMVKKLQKNSEINGYNKKILAGFIINIILMGFLTFVKVDNLSLIFLISLVALIFLFIFYFIIKKI